MKRGIGTILCAVNPRVESLYSIVFAALLQRGKRELASYLTNIDLFENRKSA